VHVCTFAATRLRAFCLNSLTFDSTGGDLVWFVRALRFFFFFLRYAAAAFCMVCLFTHVAGLFTVVALPRHVPGTFTYRLHTACCARWLRTHGRSGYYYPRLPTVYVTFAARGAFAHSNVRVERCLFGVVCVRFCGRRLPSTAPPHGSHSRYVGYGTTRCSFVRSTVSTLLRVKFTHPYAVGLPFTARTRQLGVIPLPDLCCYTPLLHRCCSHACYPLLRSIADFLTICDEYNLLMFLVLPR